ncbi:Transcription factor [Penicillium maclennaniae]|uniref:Transcription factor n=1 Tax=Penicillium maclennaniae TaxID=1343394 RepID=UPI002541E152|nr:Transcription factor [Penicillium maclennaniae]KAJ5674525.1 Transcription factor [Penicillium maclennaniae]
MPATANKGKAKKCLKAALDRTPAQDAPARSNVAIFPPEDVRVSVSERYLRQLEEHLNQSNGFPRTSGSRHRPLSGPSDVGRDINLTTTNATSYLLHDQPEAHLGDITNETPHQQRERSGSDLDIEEERRSRFSRNPLVDRDPSFAQTPDGRFYPWHLDGMAFKLQWKPMHSDEVPDVANLPPLDYALFLFNTVKFYFGFLSFMIDEDAYLRNLHEFYKDPAAKAATSRYWYAQYLLVLAFGKAFLTQKNASGAPPGHQYASRAMALLPDLSGMHEDPLTCIQALSLGAVYLQSIDMRRAAFQHIGQALRGCIIEGIHRHVPEELGGPELSRRCRTIFWVVYMLDREFSALMGAPSSIRDEDITVRLPAEVEHSVEHINLTLHVRLSRLMAEILANVYGVGDEFNGSLVRNMQSILHSMAELSHDLTAFLNTHFHGLISRASKMAIRLMLAHHHCVVLTTRPLVMCALHMHIERTERRASKTISLSPPVASLLQCCADSAQTILQTLQTLADDDLIDAFLPFQIEDASSSAFVLYLLRAISPELIHSNNWCENLNSVLDKLISKGNLAAPLRKQELKQLEQILAPLTPNLSISLPPVNFDEAPDEGEEVYDLDHVGVGDEFEWDLLGLNSSVSLPPRELLDLADQLDVESIMQSVNCVVESSN